MSLRVKCVSIENRFQRWRAICLAGRVLFLSGILLFGGPGCNTCNRDGCNVFGTPVADNGQTSIAGVVALESDVVNNGCQECPLSSATMSLWPVSEPVTDNASARNIVKGGTDAITVQANARYQQAVDAGSYLLCVRSYCVNVSVLDGHVTPVNVLQPYGPVQFKVFDPVTHTVQTTSTFTTSP